MDPGERHCCACDAPVPAGNRCAACGAALSAGDFRVVKVLSQCEHARVYLAVAPDGVNVSLKELLFAHVPDAATLDAFEREARLLASVTYPNLPRFVGWFREGEGVQTRFYLAQEFIEGRSLLEQMESHRFSEDEALDIARSVLRTLIYLHSRQPPIIHRDIKPANLIIRPNGGVALIDFGAARGIQTGSTVNGTFVGTFGYAPVEQLGGIVNETSDLHALGATLVHLLTRRAPESSLESDFSVALGRELNVSRRTRRWIGRLVAARREDRFPTAHIALQALDSPEPRGRANWLAVTACALALVFAAAALSRRGAAPRPAAEQPPVTSAVTPPKQEEPPPPLRFSSPPHSFDFGTRAINMTTHRTAYGGRVTPRPGLPVSSCPSVPPAVAHTDRNEGFPRLHAHWTLDALGADNGLADEKGRYPGRAVSAYFRSSGLFGGAIDLYGRSARGAGRLDLISEFKDGSLEAELPRGAITLWTMTGGVAQRGQLLSTGWARVELGDRGLQASFGNEPPEAFDLTNLGSGFMQLLTVSWNPSETQIYLDTKRVLTHRGGLRGFGLTVGGYVDTVVDDVRLYEGELSPQQVYELKCNPYPTMEESAATPFPTRAQPTPALRARWRFDEDQTAGTVRDDTGRFPIRSFRVISVPGVFGRAIQYPGVGGVNLDGISSAFNLPTGSLSCWVRVDSPTVGFLLYADVKFPVSGTRFSMRQEEESRPPVSVTTGDLDVGRFHLIAFTWGDDGIRSYVDGKLHQRIPNRIEMSGRGSGLELGTGPRYGDGIAPRITMDDMRLYEGPLSDADIRALWDEGKANVSPPSR